MTVAHHLRGYRWDSGNLGVEFYLDAELVPVVRSLLPQEARHSELLDPIELTPRQTLRLADAMGRSVDLDGFDYFIEADEDWRAVAGFCDEVYLKA